jgi:hypothetical protein
MVGRSGESLAEDAEDHNRPDGELGEGEQEGDSGGDGGAFTGEAPRAAKRGDGEVEAERASHDKERKKKDAKEERKDAKGEGYFGPDKAFGNELGKFGIGQSAGEAIWAKVFGAEMEIADRADEAAAPFATEGGAILGMEEADGIVFGRSFFWANGGRFFEKERGEERDS